MPFYHYTNADALSLILSNRTLRFSRCDLLDDASEVPFRTEQLDQRRFFVSSWSRGTHGEAGMWARYCDADRGVRISLPKVRFPWSTLRVDLSRGTGSFKQDGTPEMVVLQIMDVPTPYDEKTFFGNGYVLLPMGTNGEAVFGSDVLYASDPAAEVKHRVTLTGEGMTFHGDGTYLARVKGNAWADQAEYRFVVSAVLGPALDYATEPDSYRDALLDLIKAGATTRFANFSPNVRYIDLPLSHDAFDGLVVTLGSAMPSAKRDALETRVKEIVPTAVFEECALKVRSSHR